MKVLLSIKPEYAVKIFEGTKKFEFRKSIFKNRNIKTVVVYASSPMQKVLGEFEIEDIYSLAPEILWKKTKQYSGISRSFFFGYFAGRKIAHAIKIKKIKKYDSPLCIKRDLKKTPPQSYLYLSK